MSRARAVRRPVAAVAFLVAAAACGGGSGAVVALDGSPRFPDDQGVATDMVRGESVTLDGERTYDVRSDLVAFSTFTLAAEPMMRREDQYVLVGVRDGELAWMAGVSEVLDLDGRRLAFYDGSLVEADAGTLIFADGTVLRAADGLVVPEPLPVRVAVDIDAEAHEVVAVRDAAGRAVVDGRVLAGDDS